MLTIGDKAPIKITIKNSEGNPASLADLSGRYVVLYFYPKDNTSGCTREACSIRDWRDDIKKLGALVIGVSKDSPKSHQGFSKKHNLNFDLWSDEEHALMQAFGTWQQKSFMGRKYMGTTRSTFVIDPKGNIVKVWAKVTPDDHGEEIYEFLKEHLNK